MRIASINIESSVHSSLFGNVMFEEPLNHKVDVDVRTYSKVMLIAVSCPATV